MPRLIGQKLRFLRTQHDLTQADLVQRLGFSSQSHIAKVEANEDRPSLTLVVCAAQIFGISTDYLLRDTIPLEDATSYQSKVIASNEAATFGSRLRALRLQHGLSQGALARQLGLASSAYIGGLETVSRKLPSLELVVQIADRFDITTDALLLNIALPTTNSAPQKKL